MVMHLLFFDNNFIQGGDGGSAAEAGPPADPQGLGAVAAVVPMEPVSPHLYSRFTKTRHCKYRH